LIPKDLTKFYKVILLTISMLVINNYIIFNS